MQLITLYGQASNKKWIIEVNDKASLDLTILEFLRSHNFPIASSCDGEKVCQLCTINEGLLACNVLVKDIITKYNSIITITYL